jgi:hypothetical protein
MLQFGLVNVSFFLFPLVYCLLPIVKVGTIESAYAIINRKLISLSEQQVIDCSDNFGCDGGYVNEAFNYAIEYGLERDADYPYINAVLD